MTGSLVVHTSSVVDLFAHLLTQNACSLCCFLQLLYILFLILRNEVPSDTLHTSFQFNSAGIQCLKFNPKVCLATLNKFVTQITYTYSLVSFQQSRLATSNWFIQSKNCLQYQKWSLYKVKEAFSKPTERRNDPPSYDQGLSTALHNSHHVHAMVPMPKLAHLLYIPHFLLGESLPPKCIPPPINR